MTIIAKMKRFLSKAGGNADPTSHDRAEHALKMIADDLGLDLARIQSGDASMLKDRHGYWWGNIVSSSPQIGDVTLYRGDLTEGPGDLISIGMRDRQLMLFMRGIPLSIGMALKGRPITDIVGTSSDIGNLHVTQATTTDDGMTTLLFD